MRILVAGAAGYVGTFLCKKLIQAGHSVIGLSLGEHEQIIKSVGAEFFAHDLSSKQDLELPPIDAAYYLAQSPFYREMPQRVTDLFNVNVSGLAAVAEAARRAGAGKLIYTSTGNVYCPSYQAFSETSPVRRDDFYGLSKLTGEYLVELYSKYYDVVISRMFAIYGPGQRNMLIPKLIDMVKTGQAISLEPSAEQQGDLEGLRLTPCFVEDAVTVLAAFVTTSVPQVINVAGPETVSIKSVAETIGEIAGRQPNFASGAVARKGNLIADSRLLNSVLPLEFTPIKQGLKKTIEE